MTESVPQIPTLCSAEQATGVLYEINVVSPTPVLEGNMRRAWASALFQTIEAMTREPSLHGACSNAPSCELVVSDSTMAQNSLVYWTFIDSRLISVITAQAKSSTGAGTVLSDDWYIAWWDNLYKRSEAVQSAKHAMYLAKSACEAYAREFAPRYRAFKHAPPDCSVMLATDKKVYLVMTFKEFIDAVDAGAPADLARTIGRTFDGTGYDGQLVLTSEWVGDSPDTWRIHRAYSFRSLEFAYEEMTSGVRTEAAASVLLSLRYFEQGQELFDRLPSLGPKEAVYRGGAVVRLDPSSGGNNLIYTTDGAVWRLSTDSLVRCGIGDGSEFDMLLFAGQNQTMTIDSGPAHRCEVNVVFAGSW